MDIRNIIYGILIVALLYNILYDDNIIEHAESNTSNNIRERCIYMFSKIVDQVKKLNEYDYLCQDANGKKVICNKDEMKKKIITKEECQKYNEEDNKILRYNKKYHIKNSTLKWYVQTCNDNDYIGFNCNKQKDKNIVQANKNNSESQFIFLKNKSDDSKDTIKQGDKFYIKCISPKDYYIFACGENIKAYCTNGYNISANANGNDLWSFKTKDKETGEELKIEDKFLIINMTHNESTLHDCGEAQKKTQTYNLNTTKMEDGTSFEKDEDCGHNIGVIPYKSTYNDTDYKWVIENIK